VGTALVYRLASTQFTSEIHWINQTLANIEYRAIDIQQGLALARCCRTIESYEEDQARRVLPEIDLLVLTLGARVTEDLRREGLYPENRRIYREKVLPALEGYKGLVLVVTNPVDLMTRVFARETALAPRRVMGLGTVVETARLRASLGSYLTPRHPAREVQAFMVGTHNEHCVVVAPERGVAQGTGLDPKVIAAARREVVLGADRVKLDTRSTLFPIVEGAVAVSRALATDAGSILTVSVLNPEDADGLCYSVPCILGRAGVIQRLTGCLADQDVEAGVKKCREKLRSVLQKAGEP